MEGITLNINGRYCFLIFAESPDGKIEAVVSGTYFDPKINRFRESKAHHVWEVSKAFAEIE